MREGCDNKPITKYKRLIYEIQIHKQQTTNTSLGLRVQNKFPHINWQIVWRNIKKPFLPRYVRTTWYVIVHDIVPTNIRLWKINLQDDGKCRRCDQYDTATHRNTACTDSQPIWDWTRKSVASYMRTNT